MEIEGMKINFENAICSLIHEKKLDDNTTYINKAQYNEKISTAKNAKSKKNLYKITD